MTEPEPHTEMPTQDRAETALMLARVALIAAFIALAFGLVAVLNIPAHWMR